MNFFRCKRELTDDEYIEKLQRQMRVNRKVAIFTCAGWGICLVAACVLGTTWCHWFLDSMKDPSLFEHGFRFGFGIGVFAGLFVLKFAAKFVHHFVMAFGPNAFRHYRLLFKYHDLARMAPGRDTKRIA